MELNWYYLFKDLQEMQKAISHNTLRKATVDGIKVCLINQNGQLKATADLCPHQAASLSGGRLNAFNEIICPLHGYRFELNSGRETDQRCDDLEIHQIDVRPDGIYLGIYE